MGRPAGRRPAGARTLPRPPIRAGSVKNQHSNSSFYSTPGCGTGRTRKQNASSGPSAVGGLVTLGTDAVEVNDRGRLLIRNVAMAFDAYLQSRTDDQPTYSKTV